MADHAEDPAEGLSWPRVSQPGTSENFESGPVKDVWQPGEARAHARLRLPRGRKLLVLGQVGLAIDLDVACVHLRIRIRRRLDGGRVAACGAGALVLGAAANV